MSYDLMVFDPAVAPREAEAFLQWYDAQTEWNETHDYDDPKGSVPALQAFFAAHPESAAQTKLSFSTERRARTAGLDGRCHPQGRTARSTPALR